MEPTPIRRRLIADNISFVHAIASRLSQSLGDDYPFDDLLSYGMQGLLQAAARYQMQAGADFTTFAYYRIRGAILDGVGKMSGMGSEDLLQPHFAAMLRELSQAESSDGAAHDGQTFATLSGSLHDWREAQALRSAQSNPETQLAYLQTVHQLKHSLPSLPAAEQKLLERYLEDHDANAAISRQLGRSATWGSRAQTRAIKTLRRLLLSDGE